MRVGCRGQQARLACGAARLLILHPFLRETHAEYLLTRKQPSAGVDAELAAAVLHRRNPGRGQEKVEVGRRIHYATEEKVACVQLRTLDVIASVLYSPQWAGPRHRIARKGPGP